MPRDGLVVIGIVWDDRSEAARDFMARNGATWAGGDGSGPAGVAGTMARSGRRRPTSSTATGSSEARQIGQISAASLDEKLAAIIEE